MGLIKKSVMKKRLKKQELRISSKNLEEFCKILSVMIEKRVEKVKRNVLISGRKTVRKEDFPEENA